MLQMISLLSFGLCKIKLFISFIAQRSEITPTKETSQSQEAANVSIIQSSRSGLPISQVDCQRKTPNVILARFGT